MTNHIVKLLRKIVSLYGIPVSCKTIEQTILTHPDYPSMQCLADALIQWKIKYVILKSTLDEFRALGVPAIVHLKKEEFVWLTQITDSKVHYWSAVSGNSSINIADFEQEWSRVILIIEDLEGAGEPDYRQKHKKEVFEKLFNYAIICAIVLLSGILLFFAWRADLSVPLWGKISLLTINGIGLYISYVLVRHEKYQFNRITDKFCIKGNHIDCNKVTTSQFSRLFGVVSWAELGMAYFISVLFWIIIAPANNLWVFALWWLMIGSLPFTLWSLITQGFIIRKWCLFCCTVVVLLWINTFVMYLIIPHTLVLDIQSITILLLLFTFCLAATIYWYKTEGWKEKLYTVQRQITKIKYDIKVLHSQSSIVADNTDVTGFTWNVTNEIQPEIALYISIYCPHCGKALKEFYRLKNLYPDLGYRLIFAVDPNMDEASKTVVRYFIEAYQQYDGDQFFEVMNTWYDMPERNIGILQKTFPVNPGDNEQVISMLEIFNQQAQINYAPALLVNGKLLSDMYNYKDLISIGRTLIEL